MKPSFFHCLRLHAALSVLVCLLLHPVASAEELSFKKDLFPLLKQSATHSKLFKNYSFHLDEFQRKENTITSLVSAKVEKKAKDDAVDFTALRWQYVVTFNTVEGQDGSKSISSILF